MRRLRWACVLFILCAGVAVAQQQNARERQAGAELRDGRTETPADLPEDSQINQQRWQWFTWQRTYPQGVIPRNARSQALRQMMRMEQLQLQAGATAGADLQPRALTSTWKISGPAPLATPFGTWSGQVLALAIDPRNSSVVYAGTAGGGVWKTTDGGATWLPLTDSQPSLAINYITIDPNNPNTIYAGTGASTLSLYGEGILKSTDAGASWTSLPGPASGTFTSSSFFALAHVMEIAVQPGNSSVLLAAVWKWSDAGIYRSTDGGQTWSATLTGGRGYQVMFDPSNASVAWATITDVYGSSADGVYKSADGGLTWQRTMGAAANALPSSQQYRYEIALARSNTQTLYAVLANKNASSSLAGVWKTTDGGQNWTKQAATVDICNAKCSYDAVTRVSPTNPNLLLSGGEFPYISTDGGSNWTLIWQDLAKRTYTHGDVRSLEFSASDNKLYLGDDGGAWSTTDITSPTFAWTNLNASLSTVLFYPGISIHPTNVNIGYGGSQDLGLDVLSSTGSWNWTQNCDGGWTAVDPANPTNVYGTCDPGSGLLFKSAAAGVYQSWTAARNGISSSEFVQFIPPLAMDSLDPKTLYFGTTRMYQSRDYAGTWTPISLDLTGGATSGSSAISSMAVAPTDSNTVYATTGTSKVWVTSNATAGSSATWTQISSGLPTRFPTMVVVDPASASTAYVTYSGFSGFSGDTKGHVFRTTNKGSTWTDISGNLPNIPANDLAVDPDLANTLYLGTDIGVFMTSDGGTTWTPLSNGLPHAIVNSLKLHRPSRTLRAATYGRGAWDLAVPISGFVPQSGWWWDSKLSGIGFFVEYGGKSGNGLFVGGFLYDASGNSSWLASTGQMSGTSYASTWSKVSGGQTLTGPYKSPSASGAGNLGLTFSDSTHAVMTRPDGSQINLSRFSFTGSATPVAPLSGAPQSGWWWAGSSLSGTGYGIEIQGSSVFIVAYVYDDSGNPVWYLATGGLSSPTSYSGTWDLYAGGPQLTSPEGTYSAHSVAGKSVAMSLTFSDGTHGTLTMGSVSIPIVRFQEF